MGGIVTICRRADPPQTVATTFGHDRLGERGAWMRTERGRAVVFTSDADDLTKPCAPRVQVRALAAHTPERPEPIPRLGPLGVRQPRRLPLRVAAAAPPYVPPSPRSPYPPTSPVVKV